MTATTTLLLTFASVGWVCMLRSNPRVPQRVRDEWYEADKSFFVTLALVYLGYALVEVAKDHWRTLDALCVWLTSP